LMHVGGQGNPSFTGSTPVSPSGMKCSATGYPSRELSQDEIEGIRRRFIASARLAYRAGFRVVELHLAHGYLLHEFLSEHTNRRKDEYGGSAENRMRLIREIITGIRQAAPYLSMGVRISGEDYLPDGINRSVNRSYLPMLEEAGVAYFSVTAGIYETGRLKHEAMARGEFFDYARSVKFMVSRPVIGVGKILDLEAAEEHLARDDCDMVAIGRGQVADPFMIEKSAGCRPFNRCAECGQCQYLRAGTSEMSCPQWREAYA
jgi:NADPH2 dehydrogenase